MKDIRIIARRLLELLKDKRTIATLGTGALVGASIAAVVTLSVTRCSCPKESQTEPTAIENQDTASTSSQTDDQLGAEQKFSRALSGPCVLAGQVTDEAGSPVAGATVALRVLDEPWPSSAAPRTDVTTKTGQFTIRDLPENLPYQLWAFAAGRASEAAQEASCGQNSNIVLQKGGSLTVTVTAPSDAPQARAVLWLAGTDLWPAREAVVPVGVPVSIDGLAEGDYIVWAATSSFASASESLIRVVAEKVATVNLTLLKTPSTTLRVLDAETGNPLAGTAAILSSTSTDFIKRVALTDTKGEANLGVLPSDSLIATAFAPAYNPAEPRPVTAGQIVELRLERGASVSGVVVDQGGEPLPGAVVSAEATLGDGSMLLAQGGGTSFQERIARAMEQGMPRMTWKSGALIAGPPHLPVPRLADEASSESGGFLADDQGRFSLSGLPSGKLLLRARHSQKVMATPVFVSLGPGQSRDDLVLRMRPGCTAQVRVVDERGFPLSNAELSAYDETDTLLDRVTVAKDGYAQLSGLPTSFRLEATVEGRVPRVAQAVTYFGGRVELEMSLPPANAELRGRVVDRYGMGIPDAEITARAATRGLAHVLVGRTGPDGTFVLPGAGTGAYHLTADAGTRESAQVPSVTSQEVVKLVIDTSTFDTSPAMARTDTSLAMPSPTYEPIVEPTPLREPVDFNDPVGSAGRPSTMGGAMGGGATPGITTSTSADELPVTGPPAGRGSLPISLKGKGAKVVITSVEPGSHAAAAGLAKGQRLNAIDGKPIRGVAQAKEALGGIIGSVVVLEVEDEEGPFNVVVQRVRVGRP
ncbi:MAG: carboxypeptidase regulatory-like domain-containing protein [Myxococcota bacterium]|jgi:protocatechuate 3,4-dioxygenase beta subunit|nr:carboxypeptidase regulatory-like domain-containing protein [Myxococcota bacterium]